MKTRLALPLAALLLAGAASAQKPTAKLPPFLADAKLSATVDERHRGVLTLTLTPLKGYHVYAPDPGDKFLTPTTVKLPLVQSVKFGEASWPAPRTLGKARVYDGPVTVTWNFATGTKVAKNAPVTLTIKAQGCNESDCFPPATFTVATTLQAKPL